MDLTLSFQRISYQKLNYICTRQILGCPVANLWNCKRKCITQNWNELKMWSWRHELEKSLTFPIPKIEFCSWFNCSTLYILWLCLQIASKPSKRSIRQIKVVVTLLPTKRMGTRSVPFTRTIWSRIVLISWKVWWFVKLYTTTKPWNRRRILVMTWISK